VRGTIHACVEDSLRTFLHHLFDIRDISTMNSLITQMCYGFKLIGKGKGGATTINRHQGEDVAPSLDLSAAC
jgi:hypothetical protein